MKKFHQTIPIGFLSLFIFLTVLTLVGIGGRSTAFAQETAITGQTGISALLNPDNTDWCILGVCRSVGWNKDGTVVRLFNSLDYVGLGTSTPAEKLDVLGTVKMDGFKMATGAIEGYALVADANGVGTWQPVSASGSQGDFDVNGSLSVGDGSSNTVAEIVNPIVDPENDTQLRLTQAAGTTFTDLKTTPTGDFEVVPTSGIVKLGGNTLTIDTLNDKISTTSGKVGFVGTFNENDVKLGIGTSNPQSTLQISTGYIQIPVSAEIPSNADCDEASETGRLTVNTYFQQLYICLGVDGWIANQ